VAVNKKAQFSEGKYFYALLIAAICMEYLRPQDFLLTFIAPFKISMMLALALIWHTFKNRQFIEVDFELKLVALILGMSILWIPFARNNFYAFHACEDIILYFAAIILPLKLYCRNLDNVRRFIKHWVLVAAGLGLIVIYRGGNGPGSFLWDENDVCVVLVAAIPFGFWVINHGSITKNQKIVFALGILILAIAAAGTRSRGGFLALVACLLVMWWYSNNRLKSAAIAVGSSLVLGAIIFSLLPRADHHGDRSYLQEMETIDDPNDSTRLDRLKHWATAWEMYKDNFVFGVGPGNYPWHHSDYIALTKYYNPNARSGQGRQSHSMYFTLIPELGTVGTVAYFSMLIGGFIRLRKIIVIIRERTKQSNEEQAIASLAVATIASTVGMLVGGAFISIFWYPNAWQWLSFYWATETIYRNYRMSQSPKKNG